MPCKPDRRERNPASRPVDKRGSPHPLDDRTFSGGRRSLHPNPSPRVSCHGIGRAIGVHLRRNRFATRPGRRHPTRLRRNRDRRKPRSRMDAGPFLDHRFRAGDRHRRPGKPIRNHRRLQPPGLAGLGARPPRRGRRKPTRHLHQRGQPRRDPPVLPRRQAAAHHPPHHGPRSAYRTIPPGMVAGRRRRREPKDPGNAARAGDLPACRCPRSWTPRAICGSGNGLPPNPECRISGACSAPMDAGWGSYRAHLRIFCPAYPTGLPAGSARSSSLRYAATNWAWKGWRGIGSVGMATDALALPDHFGRQTSCPVSYRPGSRTR